MPRKASTLSLLLTSSLALAAPSFSVNGSVVNLPSVTQGGKVYVQLAALAQALGLSLSYDAASGRYTLVAQGGAAATGSGQLAGGSGQVGTPYSLTDNYGGKLNFTLKGAEFVATRVNIGNESYIPKADQKLLILHYSVQNADTTDQRAYYSSFKLSVVDDQNQTTLPEEAAGHEGGSDPLDIQLKPAQKADGYQVFRLPAGASAPKLLVQGDRNTLIRYDLHGLVKALAAPYADPQNPQAARASVPAAPGSYFQVGALDLRLDTLALSDAAIAGHMPASGHRFLVLGLTVRNGSPAQQRLFYANLAPTLRLASGDRVDWNQALLKAGSDDSLDVRLNPGEEAKARLYFEVPATDAPKTLSVVQETSRPIDFDVSGAK